MDHCLAQIFGIGLALSLTERDVVGRSIILKHQRVVHRDICRPLFKVAYGIATLFHAPLFEFVFSITVY